MELLADTNALLWLMSDPQQLSGPARDHLELALRQGHGIAVSVVSLVEATYLIEKRRIPADSLSRMKSKQFTVGDDAPFTLVPFDEATADLLATLDRAGIPDMPDRMIAHATALSLHLDRPLVTSDRHLRSYDGLTTIW